MLYKITGGRHFMPGANTSEQLLSVMPTLTVSLVGGDAIILQQVVRESLSEEVTFEQRK